MNFVIVWLYLFFLVSSADDSRVIYSRDDLAFDDRNHLKQSFLVFAHTPLCTKLITETLAAHPNIRFETVLPYAVESAFCEKLTGQDPVLRGHVANGTLCHMMMLT